MNEATTEHILGPSSPDSWSISSFLSKWGVYVALALVILISAILSPAFYKFSNVLNILRASAVLGIVCLGMRLLEMDPTWIAGVVGICFLLTWLEVALGFCVGCWMYAVFFGCDDCRLDLELAEKDQEK